MKDNNLTTEDFSAIIEFIKNKLSKYGNDYIIKKEDLENLSTNVNKAIDKLKTKFGQNYLDHINQISKDYLNFKGGISLQELQRARSSLSPTFTRYSVPSNVGRVVENPVRVIPSSTSTQLLPSSLSPSSPTLSTSWGTHLQNFGLGILGQERPGEQNIAYLAGQSLIPVKNAITGRITGYIAPKPQTPNPVIISQPTQATLTPTVQPIFTTSPPIQKPVPQTVSILPEIVVPVKSESEIDIDSLINSCKKCKEARKNLGPDSTSPELKLVLETCKPCDDFKAKVNQDGGVYDFSSDIFIPNKLKMNKFNSLETSYPSPMNVHKKTILNPKTIFQNILYTIDDEN